MSLILAIDVGKGTEDTLLWETDEQNFENAIQTVLPSRTNMLSKRIQKLIDRDQKIIIDGAIMAGEPWHKHLYEYASNHPHRVIMTETAAMSLRYNLDQVRSRGITTITETELVEKKLIPNVTTSDIEWDRIQHILTRSNYSISDIEAVLISCQDHGNPSDPAQSTRDYRMKEIYSNLDKTGQLEDLLVSLPKISNDMPRHKSIATSAFNTFDHLSKDQIFVMDSSPAVVLGTLNPELDKEIVINVGNGHTIIIGTNQQLVEFAYELHTGGVTPERIKSDIERIFQQDLTHQQSLDEGGHGLYIREQPLDLEQFKPFSLIGPNRELLKTLEVEFIHPIGNMMMAGPYGLIRAYQKQ